MAIDFKLDNRGDFILSSSRTFPRLRVDWFDSLYKPLRIDFEQQKECSTRNQTSDQVRIDFFTSQHTKPLEDKINVTSGNDELKQRIIIKLRTELGEMRLKPEFGSLLNTQKHEDIMSETIQKSIQTIVLSEIIGFVKNPSVIATPVKKFQSPFFCQNMCIFVYSDGQLLFDLEVF